MSERKIVVVPGADVLSAFEVSLRAAGAHAWTPSSVGKHMAAEAAKHPGNFWGRLNVRFGYSDAGMRVTAIMEKLLGPAAIVSAIAVLASIIALMVWTLAPISSIVSIVLPATTIIVSATVSVWWLTNRVNVVEPAFWSYYQWDPIEPGNPNFLVPPEARAIALKLLSISPNTTFEVAKLQQHAQSGLDPALFAVHDGVRHPIFVWDDNGTIVPPTTPAT